MKNLVWLLAVLVVVFVAGGQNDGALPTWQTETVDSAGDVGWHTSIALDSNDRPHISYSGDTNSDLKYAYFDGSSWQTQTVDSAGKVGGRNSIALDSNNRPHISYSDFTNDDLKYAHK